MRGYQTRQEIAANAYHGIMLCRSRVVINRLKEMQPEKSSFRSRPTSQAPIQTYKRSDCETNLAAETRGRRRLLLLVRLHLQSQRRIVLKICNAAQSHNTRSENNHRTRGRKATVSRRRLSLLHPRVRRCTVSEIMPWIASANINGSSQGKSRKAHMNCRSALRYLYISISALLRVLLSSLALLSRFCLGTDTT